MHRITILTVGRIKAFWISDGCAEFTTRLKLHFNVMVQEIPPSRQKDPEKQKQEESEQILHALEKQRGDIFLLDEAGESMTSKQFSIFLGKASDVGISLTFIIGGAYGVSDGVKDVVRGTIRLSDMTLTHEMARLLLLEQLYRASEILRGSGYHH